MTLCECGCGQSAPLATRTRRYLGTVEGQPLRFIIGHSMRGRKREDQPLPARFWAKVDKRGPDDCWPWLAFINPDGYGRFSVDGEGVFAHRVSYEMAVGPIPENTPGEIWTIDHLCRNRACVNPAHLEVVLVGENSLRGEGIIAINARKTHCIRGHAFTPANTYTPPSGGRYCRTCRRLAVERYRSRNAA